MYKRFFHFKKVQMFYFESRAVAAFHVDCKGTRAVRKHHRSPSLTIATLCGSKPHHSTITTAPSPAPAPAPSPPQALAHSPLPACNSSSDRSSSRSTTVKT
jgi:hypothetical protein